MSDPRAKEGPQPFTNREPDNTAGREMNAARPLDREQPTEASPERYPSVRRDDAVEVPPESRSFDAGADAPRPRQGAGDASPAINEDHMGPQGEPTEGRRD